MSDHVRTLTAPGEGVPEQTPRQLVEGLQGKARGRRLTPGIPPHLVRWDFVRLPQGPSLFALVVALEADVDRLRALGWRKVEGQGLQVSEWVQLQRVFLGTVPQLRQVAGMLSTMPPASRLAGLVGGVSSWHSFARRMAISGGATES